jgi:membrane-bound inhibitor of C-type lysozyme
MLHRIACAAAASAAIASTFALTALAAGAFADETATVHYRCEDGAHLPVAYVNAPAGDSYAVLVHDAKLDVLKAGISGSGVRYTSIDGSNLVWHMKGNEGFLAQDDADETMILRNCKAR